MRTKSASQLTGMALLALATCIQPSFADQYSEGTAAYTSGNFAAAKAHFIKATQAKPKQWEAHYQLANTYVQLKDSASAKASYQKCINLNPPADVKGMCTNALAVIERNPKLAPPAPPKAPWHVQMIRPKEGTLPEPPADTANGGKSETAKGDEKKAGETKAAENVKPEVAAQRAKLIKSGEEQIEKNEGGDESSP